MLDELAAVPGPQWQQRRRDPGRAPKHTAKGLRELVVRDRSGTGQVHRTGDAVLRERMQDGADLVSDRDPAHVLAARTDATPEPETEREQQAGQHATLAAEHDAAADSRHANSRVDRRCCGPFPLRAHTGDEVVALGALLVERLVTAVAVIPDGRGIYDCFWSILKFFDRAHQFARDV